MLKLSLRRHDDAEVSVLDRRGYYRSPVTFPAFHQGGEPANKGKKYPPEPLTPAEVYALIDACGRGPCGRRNRALIMCYWRTGLRCSEALALMPKDVDLDNGRITVLHGKGDRARVVAIDPAACAVLERWASERRTLGLTGRHPFFCVVSLPSRGRPINSPYVRELLHELARKAGVEKRVHPHGLRHSYASYLLEQGAELHDIKRMLGHSSLAITARYADHVNPAESLERMRSVSWPSAPR